MIGAAVRGAGEVRLMCSWCKVVVMCKVVVSDVNLFLSFRAIKKNDNTRLNWAKRIEREPIVPDLDRPEQIFHNPFLSSRARKSFTQQLLLLCESQNKRYSLLISLMLLQKQSQTSSARLLPFGLRHFLVLNPVVFSFDYQLWTDIRIHSIQG